MSQKLNCEIAIIGIDIGKDSCWVTPVAAGPADRGVKLAARSRTRRVTPP
jgi:hypothetical protein